MVAELEAENKKLKQEQETVNGAKSMNSQFSQSFNMNSSTKPMIGTTNNRGGGGVGVGDQQ
jgi:hypothetical protein